MGQEENWLPAHNPPRTQKAVEHATVSGFMRVLGSRLKHAGAA